MYIEDSTYNKYFASLYSELLLIEQEIVNSSEELRTTHQREMDSLLSEVSEVRSFIDTFLEDNNDRPIEYQSQLHPINSRVFHLMNNYRQSNFYPEFRKVYDSIHIDNGDLSKHIENEIHKSYMKSVTEGQLTALDSRELFLEILPPEIDRRTAVIVANYVHHFKEKINRFATNTLFTDVCKEGIINTQEKRRMAFIHGPQKGEGSIRNFKVGKVKQVVKYSEDNKNTH